MVRSLSVALLAAFALAPAAAFGQAPPPPEAPPADAAAKPAKAVPGGDPDRKVCKKTTTTGYRLRKVKLCATASEWQTRTFEDRQFTTRVQTRKPLDGG